MIGQTVSHYKILEKLGEGGMGEVYLAEDINLGRRVAIKFLSADKAADPESRKRFTHEARAQAMLSHTNIATFHEVGEEGDKVFIVMEYIEGQKLSELAKTEKLSLPEILNLAIQVGEGLQAAHERGVMHRDINPTNILVTSKRAAKITDFGLAKWKGASTITRTGLQMGTDHYMSPEQVDERKADHRTDIFSLGVVLYEFICAHRPFEGANRESLFYEILYAQPQPLARYSRDARESLERVVFKCLAKKPEERYQSAADLVADLKIEKRRIETGERLPPRPHPIKKWLPFLVPAGIILIILLSLILKPWEIIREKQASAGQNTLAVMDFENIPDPEDKNHVGGMLANLLTTSLSQAAGLEVISRERLLDLQQEMGKPNEKKLTPALATRIAKRAGVKTMLWGNVLGSQPRLAATFRLIDVQSGKILSSRRLTGFPGDSLFPFVDSLAILVTNDLKLPPSSVVSIKPVAEVTTNSPEAYRAYTEGYELIGKNSFSEAMAAFEQAIELDSSFAMAYYQQFVLARFAPTDKTPRVKYLQKALEVKERVTESERLKIESSYAFAVEGDYRKAAELCERVLQKSPLERDLDVYWRLWLSYSFLGEHDKAKETIMRGLGRDSLDVFFVELLGYHYAVVGQKKEALEYINRFIRLEPVNPIPYDEKAQIYYFSGEIDTAIYWWQKALSFRPDFYSAEISVFIALLYQDYTAAEDYFRRFASSPRPSQKVKGEAQLTLIPLHQGKFKEVKARLLKLYASASTPILLKHFEARINAVYHLLTLLALETGNWDKALRYAQEVSRQIKEGTPQNPLRVRDLLAIAYLKNGNREMAYKLLDELRKDLDKPGRGLHGRAIPDFTAGYLAYEEGKYREAVKNFEKGFVRPRMKAPLFHYGVSLFKSGRTDEAINELQRVTWWVPMGGQPDIDLSFLPTWPLWPVYAVKAHYWLGMAYEQKGDKAKAVREYEKFLDIWKAADPGIAEVEDAKQRLARLRDR